MLQMLHGLAEAERDQNGGFSASLTGSGGLREDVLQTLRNRKIKMEEHAKQMILELEQIRTQFPFSFIEILDDPRQVEERRAQLKERMAAVRQVLCTLDHTMPNGGRSGGLIH
jgi:hypothetical protein